MYKTLGIVTGKKKISQLMEKKVIEMLKIII